MKFGIATLWMGLALATGSSQAQAPWRFANPLPHGNNIIDMALRDGQVWQIGDRGSLHTSADLDSWAPHETGVRHSLRGIAFFGANACIVGEAGLVLFGPGPDSLAARSLSTSDWLESVASSPAALVAVGDNGAIYRSTDGANWSRQGSFSNWLRSVAYGGGEFLAVGENGFAASSPDGENWTPRSIGATAHLNRAAYINDRFWVVGEDGLAFTNNFRMVFGRVQTGVTNELFAIAGNKSEILLAGDQIALLGGPDGSSWTVQVDADSPALAPLWPYYSALWDGRLFLLGGRTGMKVEGFRTNAAAPIEWFSDTQPARHWLWSLTRQGDVFAAAGAEGAILTSLDGVAWSREVVPAAAQSEILLGIGGNSSALVAAGSAGMLLVSPSVSTNLVSTNSAGQAETNRIDLLGVYWSMAGAPTANDLQGVAANDSTYVVTGAKGTILTSSNGTNWQQRLSGAGAYLSGVTAWPGGFIACGDSGTLLASTDGALWLPRNSKVNSWIYSVRYLGGRLVAVGQGGLILTSDDGVQWTQRASGTTEWINDVAYANGRWLAVAGFGWMISSTDSVNWTAFKSITARSLYSAATDGQQMVAVGLEGVILRQPLAVANTPVNFLSFETAASASLFLFGGAPGQRFVLEGQPGIHQPWQTEATLEFPGDATTLIHQRNASPERARFFRTRLLP